MNEIRVRTIRSEGRERERENDSYTSDRFGANVVTLSPVGSQLAIVDGQQRYRREARHTKNNSTELPREGRGRWRSGGRGSEREKKEVKQKAREREGLEGGSWSQKRGRMERTNTREREKHVHGERHECLYEKGKEATGRDATDAFHGCMPCTRLRFG